MLKIDLIIPSIIKNPIIRKYQIFPFPNWLENWFPVWLNSKNLKERDIDIRFINYFNLKNKDLSNIVGIDSAILRNIQPQYQSIDSALNKVLIPLIQKLRKKVDYLIFFDNGDSTASNYFRVLPFVDRFLKKQLFKDFSLYSKKLYRRRLYTHYYAEKYLSGYYDGKPSGDILKDEYIDKIGLSWNFALRDYHSINRLKKFLFSFSKNHHLNFHTPNLDRKYILSSNFTIKKPNELMYFQRKNLLDILIKRFKNNPKISVGKIPKSKYLWTQQQSQAIISPFGWGEVCYRDFEVFIAGAALIKPNMDHVNTWPDLYRKNETYIPISWGIEDWINEINIILNDQEKLLRVATNGQESYKKIWSREGREDFCKKFAEMFLPN